MTAITTRLPAISVEFDNANGKRSIKKFTDANEGKRFFTDKERSGKNPKVLGEKTTPEPEAKEPTPAAVTNPKTPGVAPNAKTRAYWAGKIIAKHGHAAGVTEAMVAEVDELFGKPNATESEICLRNAWHSTRAYLETSSAVG